MLRVRNQVAGDRKQSLRGFILSFIKGGRIAKRKFIFQNKKSSYLFFDNLIIRKDLRKKKLESSMMLFNNNVILNQKNIYFLICNNELVNFYKKFAWIKAKNKAFKIKDHNFNSNGMFFNFNIQKLNKMRKLAKIYINQQ